MSATFCDLANRNAANQKRNLKRNIPRVRCLPSSIYLLVGFTTAALLKAKHQPLLATTIVEGEHAESLSAFYWR